MVDRKPGGIPSRGERLKAILELVKTMQPAHNGMEAYKQISDILNHSEDEIFGSDYWQPPRSFLDGSRSDRLYPIYPESFHPVDRFPGVTMLFAKRELIFVSRFGAMEMQKKHEEDITGEIVPFDQRRDAVVWEKLDAYGSGVWHQKNQD